MGDEQGINIVLYPREYNTRGKENLHSVIGLTQEGKEVNVKLRLPKEHQGKEGAPRISEFARTDRKARHACIASETNSPEHREGVLLFSRAHAEGVGRRGVTDYVARWATVLAEDSDSPEPLFGYGRVAIVRHSARIRELEGELVEARREGNAERAQRIREQIEDPVNFYYPLILYYPEQTESILVREESAWRGRIAEMIDAYTREGRVGGVYLRALNAAGEVISGSAGEICSRLIRAEARYQSGSEALETFLHYERPPWIASNAVSLCLTPIERINSGAQGSRFYGSAPHRLNALRKTYYTRDEERALLCRIAARVNVSEDLNGRSTYVHRVIPTSPPLGEPLYLDAAGGFTRSVEGEAKKLAFSPPREHEWVERALNVVAATPIARAHWIVPPSRAPETLDNPWAPAPDRLPQEAVTDAQRAPSGESSHHASEESSRVAQGTNHVDGDAREADEAEYVSGQTRVGDAEEPSAVTSPGKRRSEGADDGGGQEAETADDGQSHDPAPEAPASLGELPGLNPPEHSPISGGEESDEESKEESEAALGDPPAAAVPPLPGEGARRTGVKRLRRNASEVRRREPVSREQLSGVAAFLNRTRGQGS
jgi:hypothetical protein